VRHARLVEGEAHDAGRPLPVVHDARHLHVGVDARAGGHSLRQDDLERVLLGVERAPQLAEPTLRAADAVVRQGASLPPERGAPAGEHVVVRVAHRLRDERHRQVALDGLECGLHVGRARADHAVIARPELEDGVGGALAQVGVVHGAAADPPALQHPDGHVLGRAPAHVLEQARQHGVLALVEVGDRRPRALLEGDHIQARARELAQGDRAPRPCADDDRVDLERQIALQVAPAKHGAGGHGHPFAGRPTSGPS